MASMQSNLSSRVTIDRATEAAYIERIQSTLDLYDAMYPNAQSSGTASPQSGTATAPVPVVQAPAAGPQQSRSVSQPTVQVPSRKRKACGPPIGQSDRSTKSRKLDNAAVQSNAVTDSDERSSDAAEGHASPNSRTATPPARENEAPLEWIGPNFDISEDHFARVETPAKEITYVKDGRQLTGRLRTVLSVFKDDATSNRVCYESISFLWDPKNPKAGYLPISEICAYRILKTDDFHFNTPSDWRFDLLTRKVPIVRDGTFDENKVAVLEETVQCLCALYNKRTGLPRKNVGPYVDALQRSDVMYVAAVQVYPERQKQGLLQPSMQDFELLLTRLPATCAFAGPLVLTAAPLVSYDQHWDRKYVDARGCLDDDKVTALLIRTYQKCGYTMWLQGQAVQGRSYDVLGKIISASSSELGADQESVLIFERSIRKKRKLKSLKAIKEEESKARGETAAAETEAVTNTPPPPPPSSPPAATSPAATPATATPPPPPPPKKTTTAAKPSPHQAKVRILTKTGAVRKPSLSPPPAPAPKKRVLKSRKELEAEQAREAREARAARQAAERRRAAVRAAAEEMLAMDRAAPAPRPQSRFVLTPRGRMGTAL